MEPLWFVEKKRRLQLHFVIYIYIITTIKVKNKMKFGRVVTKSMSTDMKLTV